MGMRIRRWFDNLRLQVKLLMILLLALLMVFSGTLAASRMPYGVYDRELHEKTVQLLTLFSHSVMAELERAADVSFNILADGIVQNALTCMRLAKNGSNEWIKAKNDLNDRLSDYSLANGDVQAVYLQSLDGTEFKHTRTGAIVTEDFMMDEKAMAYAAGGREIWRAAPQNPGTLILVRDVREIAGLTLNSIALLALRVDLKRIVERCSEPLEEMSVPLMCAIDLDGERVYASNEQIDAMSLRDDGFACLQADGELFFCVRYSLKNTGWSYFTALDYNDVVRAVGHASAIALFIASAAFAISLVLSMMLIASIIKHFQSLLGKYDAFARGQYAPVECDDGYRNRNDEIGELHRHFEAMASENQRMIRDIYVKQQLLLEAQVRQLRAQIQPHFLYNTLESIYCLAESGGNERIATMTAALGRMLRATLNDKRDIITIEEDMRIAREYLSIQLIRYGDQLLADFSIDEAFCRVRIPAMTIQPLVENAVRHAAEEMLDTCEICIYCRRIGSFVDMVVEDNGPGMDEDILTKLERGEILPEGLGIGLANVHRRVRLAFGDSCGLYIERKNGRTRVVVRLSGEVEGDETAFGG